MFLFVQKLHIKQKCYRNFRFFVKFCVSMKTLSKHFAPRVTFVIIFKNFCRKLTTFGLLEYFRLQWSILRMSFNCVLLSVLSFPMVQIFAQYVYQSWALALYFQVRSPLISYPWIAIALALIWPISRFAHRSIALKKTSGSLSEKSAKTQNHS